MLFEKFVRLQISSGIRSIVQYKVIRTGAAQDMEIRFSPSLVLARSSIFTRAGVKYIWRVAQHVHRNLHMQQCLNLTS